MIFAKNNFQSGSQDSHNLRSGARKAGANQNITKMKNTNFLLSCFMIFWIIGCQSGDTSQAYDFDPIPITYPETLRDTAHTNNYAGYKVEAPYHWLEHPDSARSWVSEQADLTKSYLDQLPGRQTLSRQLSELQNYVAISPPQYINGAYYYLKTEKERLQGLYRRDSLNGTESRLIDPTAAGWPSNAGISDFSASEDGELLALQVSAPNSDWEAIQVYDLRNEVFLQDSLSYVRHSNVTWYRDGFFYSRYARPDNDREPYLFQQVYYHRAGTDQSADELIYADRSDPRYRFTTHLTADQKHLILRATNAKGEQAVYARVANNSNAAFFAIADELGHQFEWAGTDADGIYLITNLNAPNRRMVRVDPKLPNPSYWKTVLSEGKAPLQSGHWIDGKILAVYQGSQGSAMVLYDSNGKLLKRPKLPDHGHIIKISSRPEGQEAFISYGQFLEPPQIYRLDLKEEKMTAFHSPVTAFDPAQFETRLVTFKSYDDTETSMYIIHKKPLKKSVQHPVLLFAGGHHNGPYAPMYQTPQRLMAQLMLQQGGICAVPALRGGSALQTAKRRAGQREYKQNTFDDFQSAAEYLIANQYTQASKIGVYGEGHGALIANASLAQRPDLFGAVAGLDGLYDLLRYPDFGTDWKWLAEFGDPADPQIFDHIFAYSPVQKLPADQYPATLLLAHAGGDEVIPLHTWKMGAALQYRQRGPAPVLVYPAAQDRPFGETGADIMAFLLYNLQTPVQE